MLISFSQQLPDVVDMASEPPPDGGSDSDGTTLPFHFPLPQRLNDFSDEDDDKPSESLSSTCMELLIKSMKADIMPSV